MNIITINTKNNFYYHQKPQRLFSMSKGLDGTVVCIRYLLNIMLMCKNIYQTNNQCTNTPKLKKVGETAVWDK